MSPRRCTIAGCKSISGLIEYHGVTFHTFPLNPTQRKKWMTNCRISNTKNITKSVLVCSRHFYHADFQPSKNNKNFLKPGAVPTIFAWGRLPYEPLPASPANTTDAEVVISTNTAAIGDTASVTTDVTNASISLDKPSGASSNVKKHSTRGKSLGSFDKNNINKQRSASAEEHSSADAKDDKAMARKSLDSAMASKQLQSTEGNIKSPQKRVDLGAKFHSGDKLEAQDFNGSWHPANVLEVDQDELEVLVNFEKSSKSKGPALNDEWISMNSNRLRRLESKPKPDENTFKIGDSVRARWSDSRKFAGTILDVLENNMYLVEFYDGCRKVVKGNHISMEKHPTPKTLNSATPRANTSQLNLPQSTASTVITTATKKPIKAHSIPKFDMNQFNNLPDIPSDGEWCCKWVNDVPIGREGYLQNADGNKRPTVLVDDWRLPTGWIKHLYQRSSVSGKWDVVLVGPSNKRFRSKNDVKVYLEEQGIQYNPDVYDFSIHKRRAKDIGVYLYTKDYVPPVIPKPSTDYSKIEPASPTTGIELSLSQETKQEPFIGFSPLESASSSVISPTCANSTRQPQPVTQLTSPIQTAPPPLEEGFIYVGSLKVQIIDNLFRCPKENCNKNFRKENHLQIHIKHYHKELSAQLGVCPNMTELAYFRTMGNPIEETAAKNQIPNSHFFEKVYQTEQNQKHHRKTMTPSSVAIKPELKIEDDARNTSFNKVKTPEVGKRKADTAAKHFQPKEKKRKTSMGQEKLYTEPTDAIFTPDIPMTLTNQTIPITTTPVKKSDPSTVAGKRAIAKSQQQVPQFKIGKVGRPAGRRKGSKSVKKKYKKICRTIKNKSYDTFVKRSISEPAEYQNLYAVNKSLGIHSELAHRTKRLKYSKYASLDSGYDKQLATAHISATDSPFINEDGEVIKIVRMRQEEIINCLCSFGEEDGLMIQCELCLCWQHGACNGIEKESDVPEKYICYICRNPTRGRETMKYIHDQEWLYDGILAHANFHQPSKDSQQRFEILKQSHSLTGNLLDLKRSIHSINVKINIAANKDHPKLYLWSKKWEQSPSRDEEETSDIKIQPKIEEIGQDQQVPELTRRTDISGNDTKINTSETPTIASKKDVEDTAVLGNLLTSPEPTNVSLQKDQILSETQELSKQIVRQLPPPTPTTPIIPEPEAAIDPAECQLRLLEHIQKEQNLILARMQTIDAQIIALEAMDEHTDTNSSADFARTSQTIHMLLNDLTKLRKLAIINKDSLSQNTMEPQYAI